MSSKDKLWPDDRATQAKALWHSKRADGYYTHTADQIGAALGVTARAVFNKARREGWGKRVGHLVRYGQTRPDHVASGEVREAAYHTIAQWAEGYGLPVSPTHGFDLAGINAFRAQHGLAPFAIRRAASIKNSFAYGAQQR